MIITILQITKGIKTKRKCLQLEIKKTKTDYDKEILQIKIIQSILIINFF